MCECVSWIDVNVSSTPSFTSITVSGYTITID